MARRDPIRAGFLVSGPLLLTQALQDQQEAQMKVWMVGRDLVLAGMTYSALGRLLDVTPQSARQRFGRHVESWREQWGELLPWEVTPGAYGPPDVGATEQHLAMLRTINEADRWESSDG
jgi:hypothetical protein